MITPNIQNQIDSWGLSDRGLFDLDNDDHSNFQQIHSRCEYFLPEQYKNKYMTSKSISIFHQNCRSLSANWQSFYHLISDLTSETNSFDIIGISEIFSTIKKNKLNLDGYHEVVYKVRDNCSHGGVGLFIKDDINFEIRNDLSVFIPHIFESLFVQIRDTKYSNMIVGVIYRPPDADMDVFSSTLSSLLDQIEQTKAKCVIMGDMNIDLLKERSQDVSTSSGYLDTLISSGFVPVITKPTRFGDTSATLIDHIYINDVRNEMTSGIIINDVADHLGVFIDLGLNITCKHKNNIKKRIFSTHNMNHFNTLLEQQNFTDVFQSTNANEAYDILSQIYRDQFEIAFPVKQLKSNKKYVKREPWVTAGLLASSCTKNKLYAKTLKNPTLPNTNKYKEFNSIYNKLRRILKKNYYKDKLDQVRFDIKATWKVLNYILGKRKDCRSIPAYINDNGQMKSDKRQIADAFNIFFASVGPTTASSIKPPDQSFDTYLPPQNRNSIFIEPVQTTEIINIVNKLKPKTSTGSDEISSKLLKSTITLIAEPLKHAINKSLETGIFPDKLKIARVIPIHKSKDQTELTNYRPISLLSVFSKVYEKVMYNKISSFMNSQNLFYEHQYGFRDKHSTIHPVIHLLNKHTNACNLNSSNMSLAVFCDLSKAFDVIDHEILLYKAYRYGIRGVAHKWLKSYLFNRQQYVDIDGAKSLLQTLLCGVPQGSILGPLLFLIYVNDIYRSTNKTILSYADDTTLFLTGTDLSDLFRSANTALSNVFGWFCANKLKLNETKTKYIIFHSKYKKLDTANENLFVGNVCLDRVGENCPTETIKFLGLYIDENLDWSRHVNHVNSTIALGLYSLKQVKNMLPTRTLIQLYNSLIHPHISYGSIVWGNAQNKIVKKTNTLHKCIIRTVCSAGYNSHTEPLLKKYNILTVEDLYKYNICIFLHQYNHGQLPSSFCGTFQHNYDIQSAYQTRNSHLFHVPLYRSSTLQRNPLYSFPKIWNEINRGTMPDNNLNTYKRSVKSKFISKYSDTVQCNNPTCTDCQ